jgi:hypothetical protein
MACCSDALIKAVKSFIAKALKVNDLKTFLLLPLAFGKQTVMFVPGMSFQPSLIFAGKARSLPLEWITRKHRLSSLTNINLYSDRYAMEKHSSLFCPTTSDDKKMF